jgi:hypothetical protein
MISEASDTHHDNYKARTPKRLILPHNTMAEQQQSKLFGFHCCPDSALGEPVDRFRKTGVTGLMTDDGLEFIKTCVRDNNVRLQTSAQTSS